MERRYIQFALISFAMLFGSQALQAVLFPRKPPVKPAGEAGSLPEDTTIAERADAGSPGPGAADGA